MAGLRSIRSSTGPTTTRRPRRLGGRAPLALAGVVALTFASAGVAGAQSESPPASPSPLAPLTVAVINVDFGAIPMIAAVDALRAEGHPALWVQLGAPELGIECVARNQCQVQGGSVASGLVAIEQGAPLRIIADQLGNQWTLHSTTDIESCADLDGKRLGVFSEGSTHLAMIRSWIEENCPGTEPDYLVIGDSTVRVTAMLEGQLDATPLELSESIILDQEGGDRFRALATFADDLPDLKTGVVYSNADYLAAEPETIVALLRALIDQHRKMNTDPEYFKQTVLTYLPDFDPATLDRIVEAYIERGMYDATAVTPENLAYTLDFFTDAGTVGPGLTVEGVADLSLLEQATGG
jgi:NitT/TauT family transport system substrate-binding protein